MRGAGRGRLSANQRKERRGQGEGVASGNGAGLVGAGRKASWELSFCRGHVTGAGRGDSISQRAQRRSRSRARRCRMRGSLLAAGGAAAMAEGPVARTVRSKLAAALQPSHLQVLDESPRHGGAAGAGTHLAVVVVSGRFEGLPPLQRHRLVHAALSAELAGPLHALAIVARTPQQWESDPSVPPRPPCMGGSKREQRGDGAGEP